MKRAICIFTTMLAFFVCAMAQPPRPQQQQPGDMEKRMFSPEEFQKHMEGFIAFRAGLSPEECSKFFPILHEMFNAQRELGKKQRNKMQKPHELTEEESKRIILETIDLENQRRKIEENYYSKRFPKVLSWKKILKVRNAVEAYKYEALKQFSPNHNRRPNMPPNGGNKPK